MVKIKPDADQYVYWSTIVDAPIICGTKKEVKAYIRRGREGGTKEQLKAWFARADETGTSMFPWKERDGTEHSGFFAWDETTFLVEQRGMVNREDIPELTRCMVAGEPYPHILQPFEDGHIIGWDGPCQHCAAERLRDSDGGGGGGDG